MDQTLPDYIDDAVEILAVGINPSLHAVRAGFPFAFARNRFWPALNASRLVDERLAPGVSATRRLLAHYHVGFTDIVKRPTPGMGDLRQHDYATGAPLLREKIERARPRVLWFHGKTAADAFSRYVVPGRPEVVWALQEFRFLDADIFVSPNPSPANASYSLADITASYNELAAIIGR